MYSTNMRNAFIKALKAAPVGKVQKYVRRGMAHGAGTRAPRIVRKARVPQVWSSKHAEAEFMPGRVAWTN